MDLARTSYTTPRSRLASPSYLSLLAAFVATRVALLFFYVPSATDLRIYLGWVVQAATGRVAYADFPVEYPPLAWWVMRLPGTIDRLGYYFRFRALMCGADLAAFVLLAWIVARRRPAMLMPFGVLYMAVGVILGHELYDRLDMGVLCFVALALFAWVAAFDGPHRGCWLAAAYAAVGAGAAYKLFPGVLLPFLAISELQAGARWRAVVLRGLLAVVVAVAPLAVTWSYAGTGAFGFLGYHGTRGIEIESVWASLMWLLSLVGQPATVVVRFGGWELAGEAERPLLVASSVLTIGCPAALALWGLALLGRFNMGRAYVQALLALSALVIVSKVFSPQYLIWAIPALAVAGTEVATTRRRYAIVVVLLVACAALTTYVYPMSRREMSIATSTGVPVPRVMIALLARNLICAATWLWLAAGCAAKDLQARRTAPGRPS